MDEPHVASLQDDIASYERMRSSLESAHLGEWVLIHDLQLVQVFPDFELAAGEAVRLFGRGPYLIRQVGAKAVSLPASVMFKPVDVAS